MLSLTVEYALRAVVCLAEHPTEPLTAARVAELAQVPGDYLAKVLGGLAKGGLVHSRRGRGGGFGLARPASAISVLDVVNAVEPLPRIRHCPLGKSEHSTSLCPLHRHLDEAVADIERRFGATAVGDLLSKSGKAANEDCAFPRTLEFPAAAAARGRARETAAMRQAAAS